MNKLFRSAAFGALAACTFAATSATAAEAPDQYFFIDGSFVIHDERIPDADTTFGGRVGLGGIFSRGADSATGIEVGIFGNPLKTSGSSGDQQTGLMIDLMQFYQTGTWNPYIFAGIGMVGEHIGPSDGAYPSLEAGGGLLFDIGRGYTLRTSLSAMSVRNDELDPGIDAYVDWRLNVGLFFPMGSAAPAAKPAATPARAVDSDGDGLTDSADRCPTTPASTADGCPPPAPVAQTDSDGDGVGDNDDTCPGTLEGLKVDARGCAVQSDGGEKQSIVLKGVTFLPGSATLTEDAKGVLESAAAALNGQKDLKAEIGGHTDAQGADAANQRLSQRRADSVRKYLMDKGVEGERLTAVGYGEAKPIASNDTPEGRAENRRVEFKLQ
jgi:OOP family OmpA-OmpF porin